MIVWQSLAKVAEDIVKPLWKPQPNVPPAMRLWKPRPANGIHVFQKGDNLMKIGDMYGVSHRRLAEANPTVNPNSIRLGAKINIPITDRDWMIQTKKFDPEAMMIMPDNVKKAIRMQESADCKYLRPFCGTSTAKGMYQMLQDRFNITQRNHPEMAGWKHDDLLTDSVKAQKAFDWAIQDNARRYQYLNGSAMPINYMIRSWHQPGNIFNQRAIDYEKAVKAKIDEILKAVKSKPPMS